MKIFIDTEFYEFQPWIATPRVQMEGPPPVEPIAGANAAQLISIGAVREDGAEFYAENADFDWSVVPEDHWLQENVRPHLFSHPTRQPVHWRILEMTRGKHVDGGYLSAEVIAQDFKVFASGAPDPSRPGVGGSRPEFWAYYADYDWVTLCGLYGRMIDLPKGWPMFCMDLKQFAVMVGDPELPKQSGTHHHALEDARWNAKVYTHLESHWYLAGEHLQGEWPRKDFP